MADQGKYKQPGKVVRLRPDTVERLENLQRRGQTYDGVIGDVLDELERYARRPKKGKSGK